VAVHEEDTSKEPKKTRMAVKFEKIDQRKKENSNQIKCKDQDQKSDKLSSLRDGRTLNTLYLCWRKSSDSKERWEHRKVCHYRRTVDQDEAQKTTQSHERMFKERLSY